MNNFTNALGLDVGAARVGVARINAIARIPEPLCVLKNDETFPEKLGLLLKEHDIDVIVVGRPRSLNGTTTEQTSAVEKFISDLKVGIPYIFQDETLSTVAAAGFVSKKYPKDMEDALAACIILQDYVEAVREP